MKAAAYGLVIATLLAGCARQAAPSSNLWRASAHETIEIRTAPGTASTLIAGLQRRIGAGSNETFDVQPLYEPRQTSRITAASYVAALTDAESKARAIATTLGVILSAPRSIVDVSVPGTRAAYGPQRAGVIKSQPAAVRVPAGSPIALAVTFYANGDENRAISIVGYSDTPPYRENLSDARGVRVSIFAHGSDGKAASVALRAAEDSVRRATLSLGIPPHDISVASAGFSGY